MQERFKDINRVIRNHKSKYRQYNTANAITKINKTKEQTTIYKTKDKYISDLYLYTPIRTSWHLI